jgi:hypothetical protein
MKLAKGSWGAFGVREFDTNTFALYGPASKTHIWI